MYLNSKSINFVLYSNFDVNFPELILYKDTKYSIYLKANHSNKNVRCNDVCSNHFPSSSFTFSCLLPHHFYFIFGEIIFAFTFCFRAQINNMSSIRLWLRYKNCNS